MTEPNGEPGSTDAWFACTLDTTSIVDAFWFFGNKKIVSSPK